MISNVEFFAFRTKFREKAVGSPKKKPPRCGMKRKVAFSVVSTLGADKTCGMKL